MAIKAQYCLWKSCIRQREQWWSASRVQNLRQYLPDIESISPSCLFVYYDNVAKVIWLSFCFFCNFGGVVAKRSVRHIIQVNGWSVNNRSLTLLHLFRDLISLFRPKPASDFPGKSHPNFVLLPSYVCWFWGILAESDTICLRGCGSIAQIR